VGSNPTPSAMTISYEEAMDAALVEAKRACANGDVPVGAVVIHDGKIIATGFNAREKDQDPTAHAELIALRKAAEALGRWRLDDCDLVVTLEPCVMCSGAIINARIHALAFGAMEPKTGAVGSLYNVCADPRANHELRIIPGIRAGEAAQLLRRFFEERRDDTATSAR
jgi:tRNA(adenine34) deaminase